MSPSFITRRALARLIWVVQTVMLFAEGSWLVIVKLIHPAPGSLLEQLPQYLRMIGGNSRFIFPIGLIALTVDLAQSGRPSNDRRTGVQWAILGLAAFAALWAIGAIVVVVLALIFTWH